MTCGLMNEAGERIAARRLPEGVAGVTRTRTHWVALAPRAGLVRSVVICIRDRTRPGSRPRRPGTTSTRPSTRALWPAIATRHHVGGAKSDAGDAKVLADLVRTDRHNHREVAGDSDEAAAVRILARAHQQLIWDRVRQTSRLRNGLREYFPAALEASPDLAHGDAVGVLATAPDPRAAARLTRPQLRAALRRGGRQRHIDRRATEIRDALRSPQLEVAPVVSSAFAATTSAVVGQIGEINHRVKELEAELASHFEQHPDAAIYRSMPGLGVVLGARVLGARVLGEFGDDPERYDSAKSRRNYAGTSPLTVASGRKRTVKARFVRNRRLYAAADQWALCSLQVSPGCRAFYDRRRAAGDLHHQALRALGNRLVGYLHGCLRNHTLHDEAIAWGHHPAREQLAA